MSRSRLFLSGLLVLTVACSDGGTLDPLGPADFPDTVGPQTLISDAVHGVGGNEHFFWLPPMVGDPGSFNGDFDGSQSPTVEICQWNSSDEECVLPLVATFTMDTGPGSETVRVVPEDEHYIVNWHTDESNVSTGVMYRITALVAGTRLGVADVELATTGAEAKNLSTGESIGLKDGRTLPIRFRIEEGAVFVISAEEGGVIEALAGEVTLDIPPNSLLDPTVGITVEAVPPSDGQATIIDLGPDGTTFDEENPLILTVAYDPASLGGVAETDLAVNLLDEATGNWYIIPGSIVDVANDFASAEIFHFSKASVGPAARALFCSGDSNPNTFEDMQAAVAAVMAGGTIEVCDGPHSVENVTVDRPVTVEAKVNTTPVLQTATERLTFLLDGYSTGDVIIDGITFDFTTPSPKDGSTTYAIRGEGTWSGLIVRNSTINVGPLARGGIVGWTSTVTPTVLVENTTIDGGVFAIATTGLHLDVKNSHFTGGRNRRVQYSTSTGRVEGSTFTDCGSFRCINVVNSSNAEIVGNTFAAPVLTGDPVPDLNNAIAVTSGATALISGNDFQGCGAYGCFWASSATATITGNTLQVAPGDRALGHQFAAVIRYENGASGLVENNTITGCLTFCIQSSVGASATVRNNTINIPAGFSVGWAIHGFTPSGAATASSLTIEDNTINVDLTGVDPNDPDSFGAMAGIELDNSVATAHRNTIVGAARGVIAHQGGQITAGEDNLIDRSFWGIMTHGPSSIHMQFNDITNSTFTIFEATGTSSTSNLRCNWWGAGVDPIAAADSPIGVGVVTPWAAAPIAGTDHSGCSP